MPVTRKVTELKEFKVVFRSHIGILIVLTAFQLQCGSQGPDEEAIKPEPPPPPAVTVPFPEAMYMQNGCGSCHGIEGDGRGNRSDVLQKNRMPNFQDRSTYAYGSYISEIAKSIKKGIPGSYMKSYSFLKDKEIQALATYIHSMQKK